MRRSHVVIIPALLVLAGGFQEGKAAPKEVSVNCAQNKTIKNALDSLDDDAKDYIVHVAGTCNENVLISDFQGNSLQLVGDPGAIINGVNGTTFGMPVIQILSSRLVTIQNFTINVNGAPPLGNPLGIAMNFCSQCNVRNVIINTPRTGLSAGDTTGTVFDVTVNITAAPGGTGMGVVNAADLIVASLHLNGVGGPSPPGTGLSLDAGSHVRLTQSSATSTITISGFGQGVLVRSNSHLDASTVCSGTTACTTISHNGQGLRLENGTAFLTGVAITGNQFGGVFAATASTLEMTSPGSIADTAFGTGLTVSHNSHVALFNFGLGFTLSGNGFKQASIASLSSVQFNGGGINPITVNGPVNRDASSLITGTGSVSAGAVYSCANTNPNPTPLP